MKQLNAFERIVVQQALEHWVKVNDSHSTRKGMHTSACVAHSKTAAELASLVKDQSVVLFTSDEEWLHAKG